MNTSRLFFLSILCTFSSLLIAAQEKYEGVIVTKLGNKQKGLITLNLNGPNEELLEISFSDSKKNKFGNNKSSNAATTSIKLNVALINHIIIHDTIYYLRDIKYDYRSKYYMNTPVRLVEGTLDCGMFQTGRSTAQNTIAVKLPNDELSKLISIDFDYYKATQGWHIMAFDKCISLRSKMSNKEEGYKWDDNTPQEQRVTMWKNWIKEFNACK